LLRKTTSRTPQNHWENTQKFGSCPLRSKTKGFPAKTGGFAAEVVGFELGARWFEARGLLEWGEQPINQSKS
jgi:hypothetical protein